MTIANRTQRKRLIRNAEHLIASLRSEDNDEALGIAIDAVQVMLDFNVGLATQARLQSRMAELANKALALDAQRAGETS